MRGGQSKGRWNCCNIRLDALTVESFANMSWLGFMTASSKGLLLGWFSIRIPRSSWENVNGEVEIWSILFKE